MFLFSPIGSVEVFFLAAAVRTLASSGTATVQGTNNIANAFGFYSGAELKREGAKAVVGRRGDRLGRTKNLEISFGSFSANTLHFELGRLRFLSVHLINGFTLVRPFDLTEDSGGFPRHIVTTIFKLTMQGGHGFSVSDLGFLALCILDAVNTILVCTSRFGDENLLLTKKSIGPVVACVFCLTNISWE